MANTEKENGEDQKETLGKEPPALSSIIRGLDFLMFKAKTKSNAAENVEESDKSDQYNGCSWSGNIYKYSF